MSRQLPNFGSALSVRVAEALKIANAGEMAALRSAQSGRMISLRHGQIEAIYEMAFLRVYVGWEATVEQIFLRLLCGYSSPVCTTTLHPAKAYYRSLRDAEAYLLRGRRFALWHDPVRVANRAQQVFAHSTFETVIQTNSARLLDLASIRHRITHGHDDARSRFDRATMSMAGRRYRGGRPGAFLRDSIMPGQPQRWLEKLASEFINLAAQLH